MRKWMRDRNKRRTRKNGPEQPGGDQPPPLQPSLDRGDSTNYPPDDIGNRVEAPVVATADGPYQSAPKTEGTKPSEDRPAERNSRRRGRRGRGRQRGAIPGGPAKPTLPAPGGPTGEGAEEADYPLEPALSEPAHAEPSLAEPAGVAGSTPQAQAAARTRAPKGAVVLAIGLPGSGKSTWFKRHNLIPLSSDLMRTLLFDDVTEQRYQDLVFSTLRSMLRGRLLARRPWNYVDATNLSPHERRSWIKLAHDFGYEAHAVFFDVPPEVCIERNRRRERNVPEDVMQRMAAKLRPPKFEEGFAKITVVRLRRKDGEGDTAAEPQQGSDTQPDEAQPPSLDDAEY